MPLAYCLAGPLAEQVFEPWLSADGLLAGSVGVVIGTGPGRGLGLMFVVLGVAMMLTAALAWSVRAIRQVEDDLPDAPVAAAQTRKADNTMECAA